MGTSWGMASLIGRISFNHDHKYYLTSSIRRDGSSRFGADKQYGVFPSFSAAWRMSSEPFLSDNSMISDFKLRISYGKTGNQDGIDDFASKALWSIAADYNGNAGINPNRMGNAELAWETTTQTNLGMDLSVLNSRFSVTFDYFNKFTTGLLLESNVPGYTGFTTVTRNIGEVKNNGIEISLHSVNYDDRDMKWETDFNISTINNEIVKIEQDDQPIL